MKVFITGVTGQLGYDCARECLKREYEVIGCGTRAQSGFLPVARFSSGTVWNTGIPYLQLDLTEKDRAFEKIVESRPDVILHCAAWTDVAAAEMPENRDRVFAINVDGTRTVARAAKAVAAKMVAISTDYVFRGDGEAPWKPDDTPGPLNVYGQSKLEGERTAKRILEKLFIVRTSWVFGIHGNNFVNTMLRAGTMHDTVRVVCDQIGTPTYTADLAKLLLDLTGTERYGCYHATNSGGHLSWYDFCREIYRRSGIKTEVIPIPTKEYPSIADRPLNSRLDQSGLLEAGFAPLPSWKDALGRYLEELNAQRGESE